MRSKMRLSSQNLTELLKGPQFDGFLDNFRRKSFQKGNMISMPGGGGNDVLIVSSGRLRVFLSYEGREFTLCFLEEGDIFSTHTRAFIEAAKDSVILLSTAQAFRQQLVEHPEITLLMTGILGEVLGSSWDVIEGLIFHDAKSRLTAFIVSLGRERGVGTADGIEFECDLTMEDISLIIGATRQTTSSLFNMLIKDGDLCRTVKNKFIINDIEALASRLSVYKK
ncbi:MULTISPECIES: Crp/Fnr family transcriptional regulator [Sodalis]|jgi:CRP-like cAMP-binding protein|uniref:Crp/Fnr family transcriptional regulator n=1 Tax=Sodalis ligni TaxID=2697027 RepID=A0A4R1NFX2_9GAMM|nr:Crp/Fnr family transcriptional regulator [Sodalis ligni]TCL03566.1 Crp/Fnr family transcriptional regulator [Sodalis ligni]